MSFRSYVKIGRRAEHAGRYTSIINPTDGTGGGGDIDLSDYVTTEEFAADQARQDDEASASEPPYTIDDEDATHWGDRRLEDVGYPVAATDAATKGYVDSLTGDHIHPYKFVIKEMDNLQPGEFTCFDYWAENTGVLASIRAFAFTGVDKNGVRPARDVDAIDYETILGGTFNMLSDSATRNYFKVSPYAGVNGEVKLYYLKDTDTYFLAWTSNNQAAATGAITTITVGQVINFKCSDLFF